MKLFIGVKALIARPDGAVLIVQEANSYLEGTKTGSWDVVGGRIENGEALHNGLKREVQEESGLLIEIGRLLGVTENFPIIKGETVHIVRIYYACTSNNDLLVLSQDHNAFMWIDPKDCNKFDLMPDLAEIFSFYNKN